MTNIVHYRHAFHVERAEKALRDLPTGLRYVLVVYDDAHIPREQRNASFTSDAPVEDMKAVLGEVIKRA